MDSTDQISVHSSMVPDETPAVFANSETVSSLPTSVGRPSEPAQMSESAMDSHALPLKPDMAMGNDGSQSGMSKSLNMSMEGSDQKNVDPILAFTEGPEYLSLGLPTSFGRQERTRARAGTGSLSAANTTDGPAEASNEPVRSFTSLYKSVVPSCLSLRTALSR